MKTRFNILDSLEKAFLAVQDKITSIKPGSVIRSIFYSISSELEGLYNVIEDTKNSLYIETATGKDLDNLIESFVQLKRIPPTRSVGYVVLELGEELSTDLDVEKLKFSFTAYDVESDSLLINSPNVIPIDVTNSLGAVIRYYINAPLRYKLAPEQLEIEPSTREQYVVTAYKNFIKTVLRANPTKPIKYLVLPIISESAGENVNLQTGELNGVINIGVPAIVTNEYYPNIESSFGVVDVDNAMTYDDRYVLGENSFISGGTNGESDESYRSRYYDYLESLGRGTLTSIEFAVKSALPGISVKAVETGIPGYVNIYLDSPNIISTAFIPQIDKIVTEYKSAGTLVNIRPTKPRYISVLVDVDSPSLGNVTEKLRFEIDSQIQGKAIGESISYSELYNYINLAEIARTDNLFYGEYLSPELYNKYYGAFNQAYSALLDGFEFYVDKEIDLSTYSPPGVIYISAIAKENVSISTVPAQIDGVSTSTINQLFLLTNQTNPSENGLYTTQAPSVLSLYTPVPIIGTTFKVTNSSSGHFEQIWVRSGGTRYEPLQKKSFSTIINMITSNLSRVVLFYAKNGTTSPKNNINYTLTEFVRASIRRTDLSTLDNTTQRVVKTIKGVCRELRPTQCLQTIRTRIDSATPPVIQEGNVNIPITELQITLKDILDVAGPEYTNYLQIKLLTAPILDLLNSTEINQSIEKLLLNDVLFLSYNELKDIIIRPLEKIRLGKSYLISGTVFKNISMVGVRPFEK